jgi:hypothetical protein
MLWFFFCIGGHLAKQGTIRDATIGIDFWTRLSLIWTTGTFSWTLGVLFALSHLSASQLSPSQWC